MSDGDALLAAILADPDDDNRAPRVRRFGSRERGTRSRRSSSGFR